MAFETSSFAERIEKEINLGSFSEEQAKETEAALEISGVRFLWSLRRTQHQPKDQKLVLLQTDYADLRAALSKEFLDRTAEIGKIIRWCPQVDIVYDLSHAFGSVSHCGWNCIRERIRFGVPIAACVATRGRSTIGCVSIGLVVEIKMDYRNNSFDGDDEIDIHYHAIMSAKEIEVGIERLMEHGDTEKSERWVRKAKRALMECGSSHSSLKSFISNVMDNLSSSFF